MIGPSPRQEIAFSAWMPVAADQTIGYWYVDLATGRTHHAAAGPWMAAKRRIAATVIRTGQEIVTAHGGTANRRWQRLITCTQTEADWFFQEAIQAPGDAASKLYRRSCAARLRRLDLILDEIRPV